MVFSLMALSSSKHLVSPNPPRFSGIWDVGGDGSPRTPTTHQELPKSETAVVDGYRREHSNNQKDSIQNQWNSIEIGEIDTAIHEIEN